ncbi:MAG: hypothetical protein HRU35_02900 [Rickettsiaceae bacterium]|nr:hypothetical protein [Rickettsiaceae bacterium]
MSSIRKTMNWKRKKKQYKVEKKELKNIKKIGDLEEELEKLKTQNEADIEKLQKKGSDGAQAISKIEIIQKKHEKDKEKLTNNALGKLEESYDKRKQVFYNLLINLSKAGGTLKSITDPLAKNQDQAIKGKDIMNVVVQVLNNKVVLGQIDNKTSLLRNAPYFAKEAKALVEILTDDLDMQDVNISNNFFIKLLDDPDTPENLKEVVVSELVEKIGSNITGIVFKILSQDSNKKAIAKAKKNLAKVEKKKGITFAEFKYNLVTDKIQRERESFKKSKLKGLQRRANNKELSENENKRLIELQEKAKESYIKFSQEEKNELSNLQLREGLKKLTKSEKTKLKTLTTEVKEYDLLVVSKIKEKKELIRQLKRDIELIEGKAEKHKKEPLIKQKEALEKDVKTYFDLKKANDKFVSAENMTKVADFVAKNVTPSKIDAKYIADNLLPISLDGLPTVTPKNIATILKTVLNNEKAGHEKVKTILDNVDIAAMLESGKLHEFLTSNQIGAISTVFNDDLVKDTGITPRLVKDIIGLVGESGSKILSNKTKVAEFSNCLKALIVEAAKPEEMKLTEADKQRTKEVVATFLKSTIGLINDEEVIKSLLPNLHKVLSNKENIKSFGDIAANIIENADLTEEVGINAELTRDVIKLVEEVAPNLIGVIVGNEKKLTNLLSDFQNLLTEATKLDAKLLETKSKGKKLTKAEKKKLKKGVKKAALQFLQTTIGLVDDKKVLEKLSPNLLNILKDKNIPVINDVITKAINRKGKDGQNLTEKIGITPELVTDVVKLIADAAPNIINDSEKLENLLTSFKDLLAVVERMADKADGKKLTKAEKKEQIKALSKFLRNVIVLVNDKKAIEPLLKGLQEILAKNKNLDTIGNVVAKAIAKEMTTDEDLKEILAGVDGENYNKITEHAANIIKTVADPDKTTEILTIANSLSELLQELDSEKLDINKFKAKAINFVSSVTDIVTDENVIKSVQDNVANILQLKSTTNEGEQNIWQNIAGNVIQKQIRENEKVAAVLSSNDDNGRKFFENATLTGVNIATSFLNNSKSSTIVNTLSSFKEVLNSPDAELSEIKTKKLKDLANNVLTLVSNDAVVSSMQSEVKELLTNNEQGIKDITSNILTKLPIKKPAPKENKETKKQEKTELITADKQEEKKQQETTTIAKQLGLKDKDVEVIKDVVTDVLPIVNDFVSNAAKDKQLKVVVNEVLTLGQMITELKAEKSDGTKKTSAGKGDKDEKIKLKGNHIAQINRIVKSVAILIDENKQLQEVMDKKLPDLLQEHGESIGDIIAEKSKIAKAINVGKIIANSGKLLPHLLKFYNHLEKKNYRKAYSELAKFGGKAAAIGIATGVKLLVYKVQDKLNKLINNGKLEDVIIDSINEVEEFNDAEITKETKKEKTTEEIVDPTEQAVKYRKKLKSVVSNEDIDNSNLPQNKPRSSSISKS